MDIIGDQVSTFDINKNGPTPDQRFSMSLLTVIFEDIYIIECGKRGFIKSSPMYKPLLLRQDSLLLGKHELRMTRKEIFGGTWVTSKMLIKGIEKFIREFYGPYLDPWKREEIIEQVLAEMHEGEEESEEENGEEIKTPIPIVWESFDEVMFSSITELKSWRSGIRMTFQGVSILFGVFAFSAWGVIYNADLTKKVFKQIQDGVNTFRRS